MLQWKIFIRFLYKVGQQKSLINVVIDVTKWIQEE